jgi:anti-anti-sigma factor
MPAPFELVVVSDRQPVRLVIQGELDHTNASELETTFRWVAAAHGASNVNIELAALEFCDSGGWRALEQCRHQGATLVDSPACLRRLFYLIKHANLLPPELHELRGMQRTLR